MELKAPQFLQAAVQKASMQLEKSSAQIQLDKASLRKSMYELKQKISAHKRQLSAMSADKTGAAPAGFRCGMLHQRALADAAKLKRLSARVAEERLNLDAGARLATMLKKRKERLCEAEVSFDSKRKVRLNEEQSADLPALVAASRSLPAQSSQASRGALTTSYVSAPATSPQLNLRHSSAGAVLECRVQSASGRTFALSLTQQQGSALSISLHPETQAERRLLWLERGRIEQVLQDNGLQVRRFLIHAAPQEEKSPERESEDGEY